MQNWSHLKDWIFGAFSCLWFNDDKDNWRLHERSRMPWRSTAQHVRTSDSSDAHFTQPIDSLQLEQIRRAQAVAAMSQTNAALVSEMCSDGQNWPQNSKTSKSNLSSGSDFVVSFYNRYYKIGATLKRGDHFSRFFCIHNWCGESVIWRSGNSSIVSLPLQ